jgi:hypothetical protein
MTAIYEWYETYKAAVLETDWSKMEERIQAAKSDLIKRKGTVIPEPRRYAGGKPGYRRGHPKSGCSAERRSVMV